MKQQTFSTKDVRKLTGVTARNLQWWDECNVIAPRREGHSRIYEPSDVIEVSVIGELRRKGISLQRVRRLLQIFRREMNKRPTIRGSLYLVTDGKTAHIEEQHGRIFELFKKARGPLLVVCISDHVRRLE